MWIIGIMFAWNQPPAKRSTNFMPITMNEVSLGAVCDYLQESWEVMEEALPYCPPDVQHKMQHLMVGLVEDTKK